MRVKALLFAVIALAASASVAIADPVRARRFAGFGLVYGRESSLPLCEWGYYEAERSFWRFITDGGGWLDWTCKAPGLGDDTCSFAGAPTYKPTNKTYALSVRDQASNYNGSLEWDDGSGLYVVWSIRCESAASGTRDRVVAANVVGGPGHVLANVDGGVVEHVRPALVRGTVRIALPPKWLPRKADDLALAIQIHGDSGWEDVEVTIATVEKLMTTFEVEAIVPELSDVRLQVRADASRGQYVGYDLQDARIFVETCIPDQNDPGTCL